MKSIRTGTRMIVLVIAGAMIAGAPAITGCIPVTRDLKTLSNLRAAAPKPLRVMDRDRTIYELRAYTVLDSALEGSGTRMVNGVRLPFTGRLPFRDLVYIQVRTGSFLRTVAVLGAVGLAGAWLGSAEDHHGLTIYSPGNSSCPYVYVWDGDAYALQGEAFGTSFGKALEAGTTSILPAAAVRNHALGVRLTNERPETHYVNRVRALAFEAPEGSQVFLDQENRAWPVTDPIPPSRASAADLRRDGGCPRPDLSGAGVGAPAPGADYRDSLELTFPHPKGANSASLIVHAVNTELVYSAYDLVFRYLGDQSLLFLDQVENDPELIRTLKSWIGECSLAIEVRTGGRWASTGAIAPEASVVPFSRLVRIDATGMVDDSVRVRLSSLAEGWRIDAVEIDWTAAAPLSVRSLAMSSAVRNDGSSVLAPLRESDASYVTLFPGEAIEMAFDTSSDNSTDTSSCRSLEASPAQARRRAAYALEVGGYLHEWPPVPPDSQTGGGASFLPASFGPDRIALVNYLVRHRESFLPLVYEHWRQWARGAN